MKETTRVERDILVSVFIDIDLLGFVSALLEPQVLAELNSFAVAWD